MNVQVEHLYYSHPGSGFHAVRGLSLAVTRGESLGLIGPNGAGKSTLVSCILGFLQPAAGAVRIDGLEAESLSVRARTGALSEKPAFPSGMSARGVLEFHHALLDRPPASRRREADALLERVGLTPVAGRTPRTFSHGMRQRLGLACALLGDPQLLILDEPATGLDPPGTLLLRDEIRAARARGATVILSSHQLDEVERACDRIAFMRDGQVTAALTMASLAGGRRILRIRAVNADASAAGAGALREAASGSRARIVETLDGCLRAEVDDDASASEVLAKLAEAGLSVLEVVPEETRLDRLFRGEAS